MCYISEQYISIIHLVHYSATLEKTVMSSSSSVQFSDNGVKADRPIILLKKGQTTATGFKQVFFFFSGKTTGKMTDQMCLSLLSLSGKTLCKTFK